MERGAYVDVGVPILYIDDRRAVCIVENILHPNKLKCVEVKAHEVAPVIGKENIIVDYRGRGFNSKPVSAAAASTVVLPFHDVIGIDGQFTRLLVVFRVEMDYIQYPVFAGIDELVGLRAYQRR